MKKPSEIIDEIIPSLVIINDFLKKYNHTSLVRQEDNTVMLSVDIDQLREESASETYYNMW